MLVPLLLMMIKVRFFLLRNVKNFSAKNHRWYWLLISNQIQCNWAVLSVQSPFYTETSELLVLLLLGWFFFLFWFFFFSFPTLAITLKYTLGTKEKLPGNLLWVEIVINWGVDSKKASGNDWGYVKYLFSKKVMWASCWDLVMTNMLLLLCLAIWQSQAILSLEMVYRQQALLLSVHVLLLK